MPVSLTLCVVSFLGAGQSRLTEWSSELQELAAVPQVLEDSVKICDGLFQVSEACLLTVKGFEV